VDSAEERDAPYCGSRLKSAPLQKLTHQYNGRGTGNGSGFASLRLAYGDYGPANTSYALACRRHMHLYGTTHDQLGAVAVGQRAWAQLNPRA
jgi:acetyl-CoA acetyltransferase